ncbi:hypothetical protein L0F63_005825 [Massospora cicadina]|nr:hypothetical protein L0F63_005825 [Massospora cicadina]
MEGIPLNWAVAAARELARFHRAATISSSTLTSVQDTEPESPVPYTYIHDLAWYCIANVQIPTLESIVAPNLTPPDPSFKIFSLEPPPGDNLPNYNPLEQLSPTSFPPLDSRYFKSFDRDQTNKLIRTVNADPDSAEALLVVVVHILKMLSRQIIKEVDILARGEDGGEILYQVASDPDNLFKNLGEPDLVVEAKLTEIIGPLVRLKVLVRCAFERLASMIGEEKVLGSNKLFDVWLEAAMQGSSGLRDAGPALYRRWLFNGWLNSSSQVLARMKPEAEETKRLLSLFPAPFKAQRGSDLITRHFFRRARMIRWLALGFLEEVDAEFSGWFIENGVAFFIGRPHVSLMLVQNWFERLAAPWLCKLQFATQEAGEAQKQYAAQLFRSMMRTYCRQRQRELFNQLLALPASVGYFKDLRMCILSLEVKPRLRTPELLGEMEHQLMVPTTPTCELVEFFFKAIVGASYLDSSGVFLEWLLTPLRARLAARPDCHRWVVEALLEKDLAMDRYLHRAGYRPTLALREPLVAGSTLLEPKSLPFRISTASLLVSLVPDREALLKELHRAIERRILQDPGDHLMAWLDARIDAFSFFDDKQLGALRIMRSDLARSLQFAPRIRECLDTKVNYRVIDASRIGWPDSPPDNLELPPYLKGCLDAYANKFKHLKPNLALVWDHQRTTVGLSVGLPAGITSIRVTLPQAAVLSVFKDQPQWGVGALQARLKMSPASLSAILDFWVQRGALVFRWGEYCVWDAVPDGVAGPPPVSLIVDDTSSEELSGSDGDGDAALAEDEFRDLQRKYAMWLNLILGRSATTPFALTDLHTAINAYIVPRGSFAQNVPIDTFHKFLERLVEEGVLRHQPNDPTRYLLADPNV